MAVSTETVRMAKSRPRMNQSERSDYLKTTLAYIKVHLARSGVGNHSQRRIRFILPAHGASHIINASIIQI